MTVDATTLSLQLAAAGRVPRHVHDERDIAGLAAALAAASGVFVARDRVTAGAANTTLTLGATPVADSPLVWKNGTLLWPGTDYTISGAVVTFGSALTAGDVIEDYYTTANGSAAGAALSGTVVVTFVGAGGATSGTSASVTVPTGAATNDYALYVARGAAAITQPTGWTQVASGNAAGSNSYAWGWKKLASGDIAGPWVFTNASTVSVAVYRNLTGSPSFAAGTVHTSLDATSAVLPSVGPVAADGMVVRLIGTASNFDGTVSFDSNVIGRNSTWGNFHGAAVGEATVSSGGTAPSTTATFATASAEDYAYTSVTLA